MQKGSAFAQYVAPGGTRFLKEEASQETLPAEAALFHSGSAAVIGSENCQAAEFSS